MKDETDEIYTMTDYKKDEENTHHGGGARGSGMNEDDDEEAGQPRNVQCANQ